MANNTYWPQSIEERLTEATEHVNYFRELAQDLEELASGYLEMSEHAIEKLSDDLEQGLKSSAFDKALADTLRGMDSVNMRLYALWSDLSELRWDVKKAVNGFEDLLDRHNLG